MLRNVLRVAILAGLTFTLAQSGSSDVQISQDNTYDDYSYKSYDA
jgi:hypothetical protein